MGPVGAVTTHCTKGTLSAKAVVLQNHAALS